MIDCSWSSATAVAIDKPSEDSAAGARRMRASGRACETVCIEGVRVQEPRRSCPFVGVLVSLSFSCAFTSTSSTRDLSCSSATNPYPCLSSLALPLRQLPKSPLTRCPGFGELVRTAHATQMTRGFRSRCRPPPRGPHMCAVTCFLVCVCVCVIVHWCDGARSHVTAHRVFLCLSLYPPRMTAR